jgi:ribosomal protein S18 acetylase RimI-like enzyme
MSGIFIGFGNNLNVKNLLLRKISVDDELFLRELFFDVRSPEFTQFGFPSEQLKPLLAMQYNAQTQTYNAQYPNAEHSIIELTGEKIGRLLVNKEEEKTLLVDIAILHNFRGQGFGSFLLEELKSESEIIGLSVYKTNFGAIKLYEKHGFAVTNDDGMYLEMEWKNVG